MAGLDFTVAELALIDAQYRSPNTPRCPVDQKPLVHTTWKDRRYRMVYFVCRMCSRIGAVYYEEDDPAVPGRPAQSSRPSSRPPPPPTRK